MSFRDWCATAIPRFVAPWIPQVAWRLPDPVVPGDRQLHLSFDDGPQTTGPHTPVGTDGLLAILERYQVPATFFLLGAHARQHPNLVREIHAAGHAIGNHTTHHEDAWRTPAATFADSLTETDELLATLLNTPVNWMRPPYGHLTRAAVKRCRRLGQQVVMWDICPPDYAGRPVPQLLRTLHRGIRPGSIVCLHDSPLSSRVTPTLLEQWLPEALAVGWKFVSLPPSIARPPQSVLVDPEHSKVGPHRAA